jgi:hypothetical protein
MALYAAWKKAPWASSSSNPFQAASATLQKSETEPSVIRAGVSKAEAERKEGLRKMGEEAAARTR